MKNWVKKIEYKLKCLFLEIKSLKEEVSLGGNIETQNKIVQIGLNQLGISSFEDVTYEKISEFINLSMIVVGKGENYYFKIIEFVEEEPEGLVIIDMTGN